MAEIGVPVPRGIVQNEENWSEPTVEGARTPDAVALSEIREELSHLRAMVSQLTESTGLFAQYQLRTAIAQYPIWSVVAAGLAGYMLAGSRRR